MPRIGEQNDRMHGLESGATMPRTGKINCHKHGLESGARTGADGSNQGLEQPSRKSHKDAQARPVKSHKDAQSGLANGVHTEAWTGGELSDTVTRKTDSKAARIAAKRKQMIADWQERQNLPKKSKQSTRVIQSIN